MMHPQPSIILPSPLLPEGMNLSSFSFAKPEVTFLAGDAWQNTTDLSQYPPIVASRPIARFKVKQFPGGESESTAHDEVHHITKELNEYANSFKQKYGEYVRESILSTWNNGGKNIKLDQTEFSDMGRPSRDPRFNMEAFTAKIMSNLFDWLAA